jgi:hypothetical protein
MQWITIIVALILAIPTYGISLIFLLWYMFKTGEKRRKEILNKLILDAYKNNEGEIVTTDLVYFEAAMKFAEENSNTIPYKSDKNNIVFRYSINDELLSIHFSKGFNGKLIYSVERLSEVENFSYNDKSTQKKKPYNSCEEFEQPTEKNNYKYSDEVILSTSYNMIREILEKGNNEPLSNNAPFLEWEYTINLLKKDNKEALIELEDGTGYGMNFGNEKTIFIVKETEGYPIFVNKMFYEINYNEIYKNSDAYIPSLQELIEEIEPTKYDDVEFEEEQLSIAIQRSMQSNNDWVFLHTNLQQTAEWLQKDNWNYYNDGIYIYPKQLDNKKYKLIQINYDKNNFPIIKASLIENLNEYTSYSD